MVKRVTTAALLTLVSTALTASAKEWFVDCNSKVTPQTGAESAPYVRIQQAVAQAASGDVITVAPGVYQGNKEGSGDGITYAQVAIDTKALTIRSSGGAAVTHIGGKHDPSDTYHGLGNSAIRCVHVKGGQPVTFIGFTFRDGATNTSSDSSRGLCGGIWNESATDGNTASWNVTLVDCVVSNCVASRGPAAMGVVAVRTLFSNNFCYNAVRPGYLGGSVARNASFYNCVFRDNRGNYVADQVADVVNCTIAGNELDKEGRVFAACASAGTKVYNTLIVNNRTQANTVDKDGTVANCVFSAPCSSATACTASVTDAGDAQYQSYLDDDWRLAHGSVALTTGSTTWLERIPADYRDKDFLGNARTTDGVVYVGAVQAVAPDVGGAIAVSDPSAVSIDGTLSPRAFCGAKYPFRRGTSYPHQFVIEAATAPEAGALLYGFEMTGFYTETRFPFWNANKIAAWADTGFVPVMASAVWTTNVVDVAANGVIQDAINSCSGKNYAVIRVPAGTFKTGGGSQAGAYNRVHFNTGCNIRLVGAGKGLTIIEGEPDASTSTVGPNATRCVCFDKGVSAVQGVTLANGYGGNSGNYGIFGAIYANAQGQGTVTDSVITNCFATRGVVGYRTILDRVTVTGCKATINGMTRETILRNCLFYNNVTPSVGLISEDSEAYNCTIFANGDNRVGRRAYFENCILNNGTLSGDQMTATIPSVHWEIRGCWFDAITTIEGLTTEGWGKGDAHFVAKDSPDGRIYSSSPAAVCGEAGGLGFVKNASLDMDGNPVVVRNGRFAAGAFQTFVLGVGATVVDKTDIGKAKVNGETAQVVPAKAGDTVTVTVEGNRPFERFIVDGVALDPSVRSHTLTVKDGWNGEPYGNVTAVFGTNWYVNAASSNDNNGGAPTDAKRSLHGALRYAKGGDVVHVAEGTYDHDDAPWSPQSSKVKSRALVPTDVQLVADGAVENTIIVGADAPSPDEGGCGDGATRCVFLNTRSVVKGFTLRGGRTAAGNDANTDHYAGGVYCANMTGRVIDCLITDCRSTRGAGGQNGRYVNCRFIGNKSYNLAPAVRYGELYGCYLADNIGNNTVENLSNGVYNCTFGAGNLEKPTATWGAGVGVANTVVMDSTTQPGPVVNCVFLTGNYHNSTHPTNCVYDQAVGGRNKMSALAKNILVVPGLASQFADGKPVSQTVGTVDFGEVADLPEGFLTDTDLGGGQRIYNAKIDAGCYEFDWRPVYARKILKSGWLTVVSASPEATAVENGVFLPSGSLVLNWGRAASDAFDHIAAFGVTGDGTLAVTQGEGDPAPYAKGTYRETRALDVGDNRFVFAYTPSAEDAGGAVVGPFKRDCGLMLMIR